MIVELGILVGKGGLHGNVFRIKPPMCFTKDDAGTLCGSLLTQMVSESLPLCTMVSDLHCLQFVS